MPRGKADSPKAIGVRAQNTLLWEQTGSLPEYSLTEWDIKTEAFVEVVLEILSTGASVFMRTGSGSRSIGFAIWEGDVRHPPTWLYSDEELDQHIAEIAELIKRRRERDLKG